MKKPVFVYGTLRNGFGNYRRLLEGNTESQVHATIKGEMYSVGSFPAVIHGDGIVIGEVMYVEEDKYEEVLSGLDLLEGYNPSNKSRSMYVRETTEATLESGEIVECYVYIWNRGELPRKVESGDWKEFVNPSLVSAI